MCISLVLYVIPYVSIAICHLTFVQLRTPESTNILFHMSVRLSRINPVSMAWLQKARVTISSHIYIHCLPEVHSTARYTRLICRFVYLIMIDLTEPLCNINNTKYYEAMITDAV
jgi:hypothetical protein